MRYLLPLLLFCSCAITRNAEMRREAEQSLKECLYLFGRNADIRHERIRDSVAFCRSQNLESTCGTDGVSIDIYDGKFRY